MRTLSLVGLLLLFTASGCGDYDYGMVPDVGVDKFLTGGPAQGIASLKDLRGNVVLLDFWATWCGPCIETIPHVNGFVDHFQGRPVRFIAVSDEDPQTVQSFVAQHPIKSWIGLDPHRKLFRAFGVRGIPFAVMIDPYGRVVHRIDPRFISESYFESAMKAKAPPQGGNKSNANPREGFSKH